MSSHDNTCRFSEDERSLGNDASLWDIDENTENFEMDLANMSAAAARFRMEMDSKEFASPMKQYVASDQHVLDGLISDISAEDLQASKWVDTENNYGQVDFSEPIMSMNSKFQTSERVNPLKELGREASAFSLHEDVTTEDTYSVEQKIDEVCWSYLDPQRNVQGPFHTYEMRNWSEAGYFRNDLPVQHKDWSKFYPLGIIFPVHGTAFLKSVIPEPSTTAEGKKESKDTFDLSEYHTNYEKDFLSNSKSKLNPSGKHSITTNGNRNGHNAIAFPSSVHSATDYYGMDDKKTSAKKLVGFLIT